jgi:hypothetical protein
MATTPLSVSRFERPTPQLKPSALKRVLTNIGPVVLLYVLYSIVRYLVADRGPNLGFSNAMRVVDLEDRFGIAWEQAVQTSLLPHHWIIKSSNWYYVFGFLPVLVGSGLISAWRASATLRHWRLVFAASLLMALVGYSLYPLTPPRMLPEHWGFVDTLLVYGPQYYGDAKGASLFNGFGSLPSTVNVYAAMPSMHVAWSVIAGILFAASFENRRWAVALAILHPTLMAFSVVVTANHYVLDIIAGLIVLGIAIVLVRAFEKRFRARPSTVIAYQS